MKEETIFDSITSSHHALLIETNNRAVSQNSLERAFKEAGKDYHSLSFKQMTVDDIIFLQKESIHQGFKKKVFIVSFYSFLREAQNRMLKTLEEVKGDVQFIFITESIQSILPTVLSRCERYRVLEKKEIKEFQAHLFLETRKSMRMELPFVKGILNKKDNNDKKDREYFSHFLNELFEKIPLTKEMYHYRSSVLFFISYAKDTSGSTKMILEYLAFHIPCMLE